LVRRRTLQQLLATVASTHQASANGSFTSKALLPTRYQCESSLTTCPDSTGCQVRGISTDQPHSRVESEPSLAETSRPQHEWKLRSWSQPRRSCGGKSTNQARRSHCCDAHQTTLALFHEGCKGARAQYFLYYTFKILFVGFLPQL